MRSGTIVRLVLLAMCGLSIAVGAAAQPRGFDDMKALGEVRLVVVKGLENPFYSASTDSGFDSDILRGFANRHGLKMKIVLVESVNEMIPAVLRGEGDIVIGGLTVTPERQAKVLFSHPLTPQRHVVITIPPAQSIETIGELRGTTVATIEGSSWSEAVERAGIPKSRVVDDLTFSAVDFVETLKSGRASAAVTGLVFALLVQQHEPNAEIGLVLGDGSHHAYGMRPDSFQLRVALDDYLNQVHGTAAWYGLVKRHFGESAPDMFKAALASN